MSFARKPGPPVSFTWREEEYQVAKVRRTWFDYTWGPMRPGRGRWWQRRHRTYYVVETQQGRIFEFYFDRGSDRWILSRELVPE